MKNNSNVTPNKRAATTIRDFNETVLMLREVMVTSTHDNHMAPGPTSLLRQ
jgi:hypothetical protein